MDGTRHQINLKTLALTSMLNGMGQMNLVGHSNGSNTWIILVRHSCESSSWVILVSQARGTNTWVILLNRVCGEFEAPYN